jgi:zinc transport system substrate-binding protein
MRGLAAVLLLLGSVGCGVIDPGDGFGPVIVATSIPPHSWLLERIGGDRVSVHTVLRPGESPTTHQPSDAQVSRVLAARVFFRSGVPFEAGAWFRAVSGEVEVVDLRRGVATRTIEGHAHDGHSEHRETGVNALDPHSWLSPSRLVVQAATVADTLARVDPGHADDYATRLAGFQREMAELDAAIRDVLDPYRGRIFVVFHPSWGYFADDYGLVQVAIEIAGNEPTDAELTELQGRIRDLGVSVIYVQPQIAGRSAAAVAGAVGARLVTLDPLAPDIAANLHQVASLLAEGFDG